MKKQVKKLQLAKETVRELSAGILRDAVGGSGDGGNSCRWCVEEPILSMFDC
jgi:hypothetical protein